MPTGETWMRFLQRRDARRQPSSDASIWASESFTITVLSVRIHMGQSQLVRRPVDADRGGLGPRPPSPRRACDRAVVGIRVRVIAAHRDSRRRPPPPFGRSPTARHVASSHRAGAVACRGDGQSRGVANAALPRGGVRDGVLPLRVLLPLADLLWGSLPREGATPPTATRDRQASRSQEGRLDHRDRQRAYRARRRRRRVTDTPSPRPPRSTTIAPPVSRAAIRPVCRVCGRVWVG